MVVLASSRSLLHVTQVTMVQRFVHMLDGDEALLGHHTLLDVLAAQVPTIKAHIKHVYSPLWYTVGKDGESREPHRGDRRRE